jgi:hypothetical protein
VVIAALSNPAACKSLALTTPRCLPATFAITFSSIRVHNTGFDGLGALHPEVRVAWRP